MPGVPGRVALAQWLHLPELWRGERAVPGQPHPHDVQGGSAAYRSLTSLGYVHQQNVMLGAKEPAHVTLAGVHRVASLIKRWILGTHHGAVQPEHLDAYLDEFVFRFNRRTSGSRGMLFYRLLQQAVITDPVTYADIVVPGPEQLVSA